MTPRAQPVSAARPQRAQAPLMAPKHPPTPLVTPPMIPATAFVAHAKASPPPQRASSRRIAARPHGRSLTLLLLFCSVAQAAAPDAAWAWGARKQPIVAPKPAHKPKTGKPKGSKPKRPGAPDAPVGASTVEPDARPTKPQPSLAPPSLQSRIDAAIGPPLRASAAPGLLREAIAAHELAAALKLAEAVAVAKRVDAGTLVDVATSLGNAQSFPVLLTLWRRAAAAPGLSPWLRDAVEEGIADALLTANEVDEARQVLGKALRRRPTGMRGPIIERLVTWGRLTERNDEVRELLLAQRDPDAAVAAAGQVSALDGDEAGLEVLRRAFRAFPGNRRLAAALLDALARLGDRVELERAVAKVVALSPSEPLPWLRLLDAHIAARDAVAARALIDRLAARFGRDESLLEALVDREQRLGDDEPRVIALFEALLRAAPANATAIEAYGEWLLVRGHGRLDAALAVLARLERLQAGRFEGRLRIAALLATHGHAGAARGLLQSLERDFPGRRATRKALAELDDAAQSRDAEAHWQALIAIPADATPELRRDVAEARRSLLSLWRRANTIVGRLRELGGRAQLGQSSLAEALLWLDGVMAEELARDDMVLPKALADEGPLLKVHGEDAELRTRVGQLALARGDRQTALRAARWLLTRDADASRELALRLLEAGLAASDGPVAEEAEALTHGGREDTSTLLTLGDLHLRYGDRQGAGLRFRRAATLSPRDTRATARLARLFREDGQVEEESEALRAVVARSVDSEELDSAGQRLLTLAIQRGEAAGLLRWLDAVTPQHPRREVIERFRLLAYDVWLRTEPIERHLRGSGTPQAVAAPPAAGDTLMRGDLALRVRTLRQMAGQRRPIALSVARALLGDPSAVIRGETMLALAAIGDANAITAMLEAGAERTLAVQVVLLAAFGRLPPTPAATGLLLDGVAHRNIELSGVAVLALGRQRDPASLPDLLRLLDNRRELRLPLLLAAGAVLGAKPEAIGAEYAVNAFVSAASPDRADDRELSLPIAAAACWALAASHRPDARAALAHIVSTTDSPILRWLAIRLLAAEGPPQIEARDFEVDLEVPSRARVAIAGRILHRAFDPDPSLDARSLRRVDAELAAALERLPGELRPILCDDDLLIAEAGPEVARRCSATESAGSPVTDRKVSK